MAARGHGNEQVKKDPLDMRDVFYEPALRELPRSLDNWQRVPLVLDQESEGACVGFASAAVANYLLHNRSDRRGRIVPVSPRMFYEMALRYDEWEGEDPEGSSIRGAVKGWFKHGVCTERLWPYRVGERGRLEPEAALDARRRPLGAYYRVHHRRLNHMHAALHEAGILLASAAVHRGWDEVTADGTIPYRREADGGHAFAVIGYDEGGFWIQNSWGAGWGFEGFGHLSYEDWLEHGWDCWVARMGVPVSSLLGEPGSVRARARIEYLPFAEVEDADIRSHVVHLGEDGALKAHGRFGTDEAEVARTFRERLRTACGAWDRRRLLLYAHGGLNSAKDSASRIASLRPYFLANHIYPVHFMWETGLWDSALGAARNAMGLDRAAGVLDRASDLVDEAIELGARPLGRPLWAVMKGNARRASEDGGGAALAAQALADAIAADGPVELHLVGHSAGAIFMAHLLGRLVGHGIAVKTLTLFAPGCTTDLFRSAIMPLQDHVGRIAVLNLTDEAERADSVGPYRKSLLYLVSESFEPARHTPLLGMQKHLEADRAVRRFLGAAQGVGPTTALHLHPAGSPAGLASRSDTHGGFDDDDATLNATLRLVLGRRPVEPFA